MRMTLARAKGEDEDGRYTQTRRQIDAPLDPCLAMPCPALPSRSKPYQATPRPALPSLARRCRETPCHVLHAVRLFLHGRARN
jgi:hypothetical protein